MTTLFPDVIVEFSPSTGPFEEPVWEDITAYLRTFSITRGQSDTLSRAEAGLATFLLDNWDGVFDPVNAAGPYYGGILPMRRVRIRASVDQGFTPFITGISEVGGSDEIGGGASLLVDLFSGFVENWEQAWNPTPAPSPDATATLHAVDAFKVLALWGTSVAAGMYSGDLVNLMLDSVAWPLEDRDIDFGLFVLSIVESGTVLALLQRVDASEGGLLFISRDGKVTFRDGLARWRNPPGLGDQWGDLETERQYQHIGITWDEQTIANDVTVSGYSSMWHVQDTGSQADFLVRSTSVDTALADTWSLQIRSYDYLSAYSQPRLRITSLDVGTRDDLDWADILGHDLTDHILVRRRPLSGELIEQDSVIQRITIESNSRDDWRVSWELGSVPEFNRLSAQQSSVENGTTSGWVAETNCTLASDTLQGIFLGTYNMQMQAVANGDMTAASTPSTQNSMAVIVGDTYTAMGTYLKVSGTPQDARVDISWRNGAGAEIGTTQGAVFTHVPGEQAVQCSVVGVAPAGAVFAVVRLVGIAAVTGASNSLYWDAMAFFKGVQTIWTIGRGDVLLP